MNASEFCDVLEGCGIDFAAGVPCSILKDIILHLSSQDRIPYVPATREDEAIGIATGAYLGGKKPVVLMQNSGLGSAINPLASLAIPYHVPVLLIVSWRGYQGNDAPEHIIMGQMTTRFLEELGVATHVLESDNPAKAISAAVKTAEGRGVPAAVILRRGIIE